MGIVPPGERTGPNRKKVGLALSSGAVLGLAHVGVIEILEKNNIPIDMIAGTSMGGLVGGLYAAGVPLRDLFAFTRKAGLMDLASPDRMWRGLFGHDKFMAFGFDVLVYFHCRRPFPVDLMSAGFLKRRKVSTTQV